VVASFKETKKNVLGKQKNIWFHLE
jgi:hypothetical protein